MVFILGGSDISQFSLLDFETVHLFAHLLQFNHPGVIIRHETHIAAKRIFAMILLWLPGAQTPILLLLVILPSLAFLLELLFMLASIHGRLDQIQILRSLYVFGTVISIGLEASLVRILPCGEASALGSGGSSVSDRL